MSFEKNFFVARSQDRIMKKARKGSMSVMRALALSSPTELVRTLVAFRMRMDRGSLVSISRAIRLLRLL